MRSEIEQSSALSHAHLDICFLDMKKIHNKTPTIKMNKICCHLC